MESEIIRDSLISILQIGDIITYSSGSVFFQEHITYINNKFITTVNGEFFTVLIKNKAYKHHSLITSIINKKHLKITNDNCVYYDTFKAVKIYRSRNKKTYYIYK